MEKYNVVIEVPAVSDIDDIFDYISNVLKEPNAAERICDSIETAIYSLRQLPLRYAVIDEEPFASREIRKIPVKSYIVFYTVDNSEVHILRVMYGRRDWHNLI